MIKADSTVRRETKYIAIISIILSVLMQIVFLFLKRWNYTVLTGNLLSLAASVANFYFMGVSVQRALAVEETKARKVMKNSQTLRNAGIFVTIVIGVTLPYFNTVATILPVFFPRIAISFRPMLKEKEVKDK